MKEIDELDADELNAAVMSELEIDRQTLGDFHGLQMSQLAKPATDRAGADVVVEKARTLGIFIGQLPTGDGYMVTLSSDWLSTAASATYDELPAAICRLALKAERARKAAI